MIQLPGFPSPLANRPVQKAVARPATSPLAPPQQDEVRFGSSLKFQIINPRFETTGNTYQAKAAQMLRKGGGEPNVQVLSSGKEFNTYWSALSDKKTKKPKVDFTKEAVVIVSREADNSAERLNRQEINYDKDTKTLRVYLKKQSGNGITPVCYSWYMAVVPQDKLSKAPEVTIQ